MLLLCEKVTFVCRVCIPSFCQDDGVIPDNWEMTFISSQTCTISNGFLNFFRLDHDSVLI